MEKEIIGIDKKPKARFEIKEAENGEYHFNWIAANNKVIMTSELYKTKSNAKRAIRKLPKTMMKTINSNGKIRILFIEKETE